MTSFSYKSKTYRHHQHHNHKQLCASSAIHIVHLQSIYEYSVRTDSMIKGMDQQLQRRCTHHYHQVLQFNPSVQSLVMGMIEGKSIWPMEVQIYLLEHQKFEANYKKYMRQVCWPTILEKHAPSLACLSMTLVIYLYLIRLVKAGGMFQLQKQMVFQSCIYHQPVWNLTPSVK